MWFNLQRFFYNDDQLLDASILEGNYEKFMKILSRDDITLTDKWVDYICHEGHVNFVEPMLRYLKISSPMTSLKIAYELSDLELLKVLLKNKTAMYNKITLMACRDGKTEIVKYMLSQCQFPRFNDYLGSAIQGQHLETIKVLLADPQINPRYDMQQAFRTGNIQIFKLLLDNPRLVITDDDKYLLKDAYVKNRQILKVLLVDSRFKRNFTDNFLLKLFVQNGNLNFFKILMADKEVDPSVGGFLPLKIAGWRKNKEMQKILQKDKDMYPTFKIRRHNLPLDQEIQELQGNVDLYIYLYNDAYSRTICQQKTNLDFYSFQIDKFRTEIRKIQNLRI